MLQLTVTKKRAERGLLAMAILWIFVFWLKKLLRWVESPLKRYQLAGFECWMVTKLTGVFLLSAWHGFLAGQRKKIAAGTSKYSGRFWRMTNEIPFILAIVMVLSVTLEWAF